MDLKGTPLGNALNTFGVKDFMGMQTGQPAAPPMGTTPQQMGETPMQTQQRITGTAGMDPARRRELDAKARAAGYRNYEELVLRQKQREAPPLEGENPEEGSWWDNAMAWHPKTLLEHVTKKMRQAF